VNLNDDVVYRCLRLGPLRQPHSGRSRGLVDHYDRLHANSPWSNRVVGRHDKADDPGCRFDESAWKETAGSGYSPCPNRKIGRACQDRARL